MLPPSLEPPLILLETLSRRVCLAGKRLAAFAAALSLPPRDHDGSSPPPQACLQLAAGMWLAAGCATLARACRMPQAGALQFARDVTTALLSAGTAYLQAAVSRSGSRSPGGAAAVRSPRNVEDFNLVEAQMEALLSLLRLCAASLGPDSAQHCLGSEPRQCRPPAAPQQPAT